MNDIFGNIIDSEVGYARGKIIKSSYEEKLKTHNAMQIICERAATYGKNSLYMFTGNIRGYQIKPSDLEILTDEWIGNSLLSEKLRKVAIKHLDGNMETDDVAIFNRTSAAIICSIMTLGGKDKTVISLAPEKEHHPSISRGAKLAQADLIRVSDASEIMEIDVSPNGGICLITGVTSGLSYLNDEELTNAILTAKSKGLIVVVDDAYGARLRPIVLKLKPSLPSGADVVITNNDKAALNGPRAGIMVGRKDLVSKISAKASEFGFEARAPISMGVYRSLCEFNPQELICEVETGRNLYEEMLNEIGSENVVSTLLGPEITAETVLKLALKQRGLKDEDTVLVPAEATAALGIELLKRYGIVTTNACGMPGAKISVRFKTNSQTLKKAGGAENVVKAFLDCINVVSGYVDNFTAAKKVILDE